MSDFAFDEFTDGPPDPEPEPPKPPAGSVTPQTTTTGGVGGFGAGPFGSMMFGAGGGAHVSRVEQLTRTSVRVTYGGAVEARNPGAVWDALHDRGWRLTALDPPGARSPYAVHVEPDPEHVNAVIVHFDAELDGPGALYRLTGSERVFSRESSAALFRTFGGPVLMRTTSRKSQAFDLANPQAGREEPGEEAATLGTLTRDADGDYLNDAGVENVKKRILRRLTTPLGAFAHMPDYGLRMPTKGKITAGTLRDIQGQAYRQVQRELGVSEVEITVSSPGLSIVLVEVVAVVRGRRVGVGVKLSET